MRKESPQLTIFFAPQVLRVEEHLATRDAVAQTRGEGFNPLALKDSMKMQVRHPMPHLEVDSRILSQCDMNMCPMCLGYRNISAVGCWAPRDQKCMFWGIVRGS